MTIIEQYDFAHPPGRDNRWKFILAALLGLTAYMCMGASGDFKKTIMADTNGTVLTTPLSFSNQVSMYIAATTSVQLVRYAEFTNNATVKGAITNVVEAGGGTGLLISTSGQILSNKTLVAGSNVYLQATTSNVTIGNTCAPLTNQANVFVAPHAQRINGTTILSNLILNGTGIVSNNFTVWGTITATNSSIARPNASFSCTNTLTNAGTSVSNVVPWCVIETVYAITTNGNKQIVLWSEGAYEANFSALFNNGTTEGGNVNIWIRQNNTNLVRSGTQITFPLVSGGTCTNQCMIIAAPISFHVNTAGEYIELLWWSDNATVTSPYTAAATSPARPASPPIIMTIRKISSQ